MPETLISGANTVNPALLALRPRQVLLNKKDMKHNKTNSVTLNSDKKVILLQSMARFLEQNGFSKTLKKFLSEAKIQIDSKGSLLDLEELYNKHISMCDDAKTNFKSQKEQDVQVSKEQKMLEPPLEEAGKIGKEKKKKKNKSTSESVLLPGTTEEKFKDAALEEISITDPERQKKTKVKEKKKQPPTSDSLIDNFDSQTVNENDTLIKEKISKSKSKKKKKDEFNFESSYGLNSKDTNVIGRKEDCFKISDAATDATGDGNKASKKRKRLISDENDVKPADKAATEESKRRKIEGVKDFRGDEQQSLVNEFDECENKSMKRLNELESGNIDKSAEKSSTQKNTKKQLNGAVEPKTVNAFQRVKVEEVVFADERLKDNSYWAKHGAEIGYGAKAQEVLGQVRGRDFRHEKTKKKRGSYKGGQIDLQSHSVKFNYSDDE